MVLIIRQPATAEQLRQMAETYDGILIKLAVDVSRQILAGGGEYHADCEQILLDDGSQQADVWGADWVPGLKRVVCESLINIRPGQGNYGFEVRDPALRRTIEQVVRSLLEVT